MPEEKQKLDENTKLVEEESPAAAAQLPVVVPKASASSLQTKGAHPSDSPLTNAPKAVLLDRALLALGFVLVSVAIGLIPYMLAPGFLLPAFKVDIVRTMALGALIWDMIGAALYAQSSGRFTRAWIFFIFATPIMTIGIWWFWGIVLFGFLTAPFAH